MNDPNVLASYKPLPFTVRADIVEAQQYIWDAIARPGTWLTGATRVAIAAETRAAPSCTLCQARQNALSPYAVTGTHDTASDLNSACVDAIHRIVTDPGRLSQRLVNDLAESGVSDAEYVEMLSVIVFTMAIDMFHRAIGAGYLPLPEPRAGKPGRERPPQLEDIGAWVPVLASNSPLARELFASALRISNVARGLSLVPEANRDQIKLVEALYVPLTNIANMAGGGRAISRAQIELIASRVSALNECFY